MDMDLVLIFSFITVVVAITGLSVNGIVHKVLEYKREQNLLGRGEKSGASNALAERTEMIEDRLKVLERLATDRGSLLSDEIEALRDKQVDKGN